MDFLLSKPHQKNFNLEEAANYCRLPASTFRLFLSEGKITGSKIGKRWVFTCIDLDKFIENFRRA
ncbi:MAG: helix-turn-helix domain-containing protein [Salinivirgaceae bacterium]